MHMTLDRLKWLEGHDWFRSAAPFRAGFWVVRVYDSEKDSVIEIDDWKEMLTWAGY